MSAQFLRHCVLIHRAKIDGRFIVKNLQLSTISIEACQEADVAHEQLEQIAAA